MLQNKKSLYQINAYLNQVKESNKNYNARVNNIRLKKLVQTLKNENSKIPKAKELISEYKEVLKQKDKEIENLKKNNQDLYNGIQRLPKIIRKIFLKDLELKLLSK